MIAVTLNGINGDNMHVRLNDAGFAYRFWSIVFGWETKSVLPIYCTLERLRNRP